MPNALIFGVTGQDGAYLSRFLLGKEYRVIGVTRDAGMEQTTGLDTLGVRDQVEMRTVDFGDEVALRRLIYDAAPDEIYNLAAQSSVARSFEAPVETGEINGQFVVRLLQAVRHARPLARLFQASSSEIFDAMPGGLLNENSPLRPRHPYGIAKAYAHQSVGCFRESFGLRAGCGILFNHESPLRGTQFATGKIVQAVARIKFGLQDSLELGNMDSQRDWGFAGDYVEAMWLMLQQEAPGDYVIATGELHSLREFVDKAFAVAGLESAKYVRQDASLLRPVDTPAMRADPSRIAIELDWRARVKFDELVQMMVNAELERVGQGTKTLGTWPD